MAGDLEDEERRREWGVLDRDTDLQEVPGALAIREPVTSPHAVEELPGFEPGYALGRRRAFADACEVLRTELIRGGTDPGVAAIVVTKFGARCGLRYV